VGARRADAGPAGVAGGEEAIVLHGDAHAGNLLRCGDRWLWTDLEEACRGPLEWDLAVLGQDRPDPDAAVRAYATAARVPAPSAEELAPWRRARRLEGTVWVLGMAHQNPDRYAGKAAAMLASLRQDGAI
jgi:Ser/Thr protein kinase RdoA (MazF antagonist)